MYLDLVIIGAGPIGITACNSFIEGLKIIVSSPSGQFKFKITHDSNWNLSADFTSRTVLRNIP